MKKHKHGFTLAEVLITLVIIGIIAAMTIPTLMNKTNEQELVVATKKAYSTLSQAYQRMVVDYGEVNPYYFGDTPDVVNKNFGDIFVKYLNVQKNCGLSTDGDCFAAYGDGWYKSLSDNVSQNFNMMSETYKVRLSDGTSYFFEMVPDYIQFGESEALKSVWGQVYVDVNGNKGPNIVGIDTFLFHLTKYGFVPAGTPYDKSYSLSGLCHGHGSACTAWVVTKGNMDYLRKDVSW